MPPSDGDPERPADADPALEQALQAADDAPAPAPPEASREADQAEPEAPPPAPATKARSLRRMRIWLLPIGCAVIVLVNLGFILGASSGDATRAPSLALSATNQAAHLESASAAAAVDASAPAIEADAAPASDADEPPAPDDGPPSEKPDKPEKPSKHPGAHTVEWVGSRSCSTAQIDGLSRQVVAEARCLDRNAFSPVPKRKNLESPDHVFLYLDAPARQHLLKVLDAHPTRTMKVHSALRTVAQQYLLSRWSAGRRCGIQLATKPGESNHETGLALDIGEPGNWRAALEAEGFRWMGSIDRVHFDFVGPGATHHDGLDVRAFQRLWNRNHTDDPIAESGHYDKATEQRLKKSPAAGFPIGARCGRRATL